MNTGTTLGDALSFPCFTGLDVPLPITEGLLTGVDGFCRSTAPRVNVGFVGVLGFSSSWKSWSGCGLLLNDALIIDAADPGRAIGFAFAGIDLLFCSSCSASAGLSRSCPYGPTLSGRGDLLRDAIIRDAAEPGNADGFGLRDGTVVPALFCDSGLGCSLLDSIDGELLKDDRTIEEAEAALTGFGI